MTCTAYHTAAESAKSAVISALNDNEDTNVLSELWRHYLGLRHISDNHKHKEPEVKFSALGAEFYNTPSGDDHIKFDIEGPYAAQPVEYPFFCWTRCNHLRRYASPWRSEYGHDLIQLNSGSSDPFSLNILLNL